MIIFINDLLQHHNVTQMMIFEATLCVLFFSFSFVSSLYLPIFVFYGLAQYW